MLSRRPCWRFFFSLRRPRESLSDILREHRTHSRPSTSPSSLVIFTVALIAWGPDLTLLYSELRSDAFVTVGLRRLPDAWFDSRTSWLARTDARRTTLPNHWNVNDSGFPVRVENAALAPWLPSRGATLDPTDANRLCLEQHHLEFYFLGPFIVPGEAVRPVENEAAFVIPFRLNDNFEALVLAGLDLALDPRVAELNGLGPAVFLSRVCAAIQLLP